LACSKPPLQSISKAGGIREFFIPEDGSWFVRLDFCQADPRALAAASADEKMISIFQTGEDFHRRLAANFLGKEMSAITADERQVSKALIMGVTYGMGPETLAKQALTRYGLRWSKADAQKYIDRFFSIFQGLRKWKEKLMLEPSNEACTLWARRRQTMEAELSAPARTRKWMSMVGQGTVADAIKLALAELHSKLPSNALVILNIHDELVIEVGGTRIEAEAVMHFAKAIMEQAFSVMINPVPAKVEAKVTKTLA
jgi:DNA polymerase-1